jgi:hypothetical protein
MKLYHVSPEHNTISITVMGIDPQYSRSELKRSWWADRSQLMYAIVHTQRHQACRIRDLEVWYIEVPNLRGFKKTKWKGVLTNYSVIVPHGCRDAEAAICALFPPLFDGENDE